MPLWRLQREISAKEFVELKAYRNRNTLQPDLWFAIAGFRAHFAASKGVDCRPIDFVPVNDPTAEERRQAQAREAEERLDREAD